MCKLNCSWLCATALGTLPPARCYENRPTAGRVSALWTVCTSFLYPLEHRKGKKNQRTHSYSSFPPTHSLTVPPPAVAGILDEDEAYMATDARYLKGVHVVVGVPKHVLSAATGEVWAALRCAALHCTYVFS